MHTLIVSVLSLLLALVAAVRLPAVDVAEVVVGFDPGQTIGDPVDPAIYLLDASTPRLYAVDTATGTTRVRAVLVDGLGAALPSSAVSGSWLALSQDRQHVYVSLPSAQRIQRYAVADLHLEAETSLTFTPGSFVVAANGYLCVACDGGVCSVDPATGVVADVAGGFYQWPLVKIGDAGTRVYALDMGLSAVGQAVRTYDVGSDGTFTGATGYSAPCANTTDLSVSEADQRLYPMNGGVYGLTIVDMATNTQAFSSFGGWPYGRGVAQVPGSALIWASSYFGISAFRRTDNARVIDLPLNDVATRGLAMAGDGRVMYRTDGRRVGLIGARALAIDPDGPRAAIAVLGNGATRATFTVAGGAGGSPISAYSWSLDGVAVSGAAEFTTDLAAGTHVVRLTVTDAAGRTAVASRDVAGPFTWASPSGGSPSGRTLVTITGSGLTGATGVTFGGVPATLVTVLSPTTIACLSPAHAPGPVDVVVQVPVGDGGATRFTYAEPAGGVWRALGVIGSGPGKLRGITGIATGGNHVLAVTGAGRVVAWGNDDFGQATVPDSLDDAVAVATGALTSVAVKRDGTVRVWGMDYYFQTAVPAGLGDVVAVAAGYAHVVALRGDGTVVAWGGDALGQTDVPAGLVDVVAIAAGDNHTLALKADGTVVGWGYNALGQATPPAGLTGVVAIASGPRWSVAIKADGTEAAWGDLTGVETTPPAGLGEVVAVATTTGLTAALRADGTVVQWGTRSPEQQVMPSGLSGVVAIAGGAYYLMAVKADGTVVDWGANSLGMLAPEGEAAAADVAPSLYHLAGRRSDGAVLDARVPAGTQAAAIAVGDTHTLALQADGTVLGWGNDGAAVTVPAGLSGVTAVAAGYNLSLALKSDGTVVAWGEDSSGQATVPAGLSGVVAIASRSGHVLALKGDGTVVAWGEDSNHQAEVPAGLAGVVAISAGHTHSLALKVDGTVVAWGSDICGESTPPAGLTGVVAIASGLFYSVALKGDGTVVGWGLDNNGSLSFPPDLGPVTAIAAGGRQTWCRVAALPTTPAIFPATTTVEWDGLPHAPQIATTSGRAPTAVTYNGSAVPPTAVGSYAVVAEVSYLDSAGSGTGTLVITKAPQAISGLAATLTCPYSTTSFSYASVAGGTSTSPVTFTSGSPEVATIAGTVVTITGTGSTLITASQAGDANHTAAAPVSQILTVTPVPLTITADPHTMASGTAVPALTWSVSGFAHGDTMAEVGGMPVLSTTATAASIAGAYPIQVTVDGMTAADYTVVGVAGVLTVTAAPTPPAPTPVPPAEESGDDSSSSCGAGGGIAVLLAGLLFARRRRGRR